MKSFFSAIVILLLLSVNLYSQIDIKDKSIFYPRFLDGEIALESSNKIIEPEELDSLLTSIMGAYHIAGLAALIVKHDSVVWSRNYGYSNIALNNPVEDSTLFLMASISKTIMITALMQLWEDGLFDLEDNINPYLQPDFQVVNPNYPSDIITFKMLMTHTSSIDDNWNILSPLEKCGDSPIPLDSMLMNYYTPGGAYYSGANFFTYPPSANNFHYTNAGSCILAFIVEKLSGMPFPQYCRQNIFNQLNMNVSSWFLAGLDTTNIATPYEWIGGQYFATCHEGWPLYPIAFLRTNKFELEHFLSAYINWGTYNGNTILDSATVDKMLTVYKYVDPYNSWGLIWYQILLNEQYLWGHTGGWDGTSTAMFCFPEEDWGAIMFMNSYPNDQGFWGPFELICRYAHLIGNIYATHTGISKPYMIPSYDTLIVRTEFSNIYQYNFTANAIFVSSDNLYKDSTALYDDGMHGDSLAGDGIWGGFILPIDEEEIYKVGISTLETQTGNYFYSDDLIRFTTAGPITVDSLSVSYNSIAKIYQVKPYLENEGHSFTVEDLQIYMTSDDSSMTYISGPLGVNSISPQTVVGATGNYTVRVDSSFTGVFKFKFEISSSGRSHWKDKVTYIVAGIEDEINLPVTYNLYQNYPNPFNPSTKISWQSPVGSRQTLKIYDVLGNHIATLVDEYKPAGTYELNWFAENLPSGVYFYKLQVYPANSGAEGYVDIKKMLLLK